MQQVAIADCFDGAETAFAPACRTAFENRRSTEDEIEMIAVRSFLALAACMLVAPGAYAQNYPAKPVRLVVGFAAGSTSDLIARVIGQKVSEGLGQPVVADNRPGAGSNIAYEYVA